MRLIADCGNSTVKLAIAQAGGLWLQERLLIGELDRFLAARLATIDELVVLPAGRTTEAVQAWWQRVGGGRTAKPPRARRRAQPDRGFGARAPRPFDAGLPIGHRLLLTAS